MEQTFFFLSARLARTCSILLTAGAAMIAGCGGAPTSTTVPQIELKPNTMSSAGTYHEVDTNWIMGSCNLVRFSVTLDSLSTATSLGITNGLVAVPISPTLARMERYDGPAVISSSTKKG